MRLKIAYADVAVGAKEAFTPTATGVTGISEPALLKQDEALGDFANYCELNSVLLDESLAVSPDDTSGLFALVSNVISGDDGSFSTPVVLTLTAPGQYTSQGITLYFDRTMNRYATAVNIKWYRDSTLLADVDFTPDSAEYFCEYKVENYNKLIITFSAMNMPQNRLYVTGIQYGTVRIFQNSDIQDFTLLQEVDPLSETISINTMDFSLKQSNSIDFIFQEKQTMYTYFDDELVSTTFVTSHNRNSADSYSIKTEDYISLLEDTPFMGGIYSAKSVPTLIGEMLDPLDIPYEIETELQSQTVTGYIPAGTCRTALTQVAFAIGAVVDTSYSKLIKIYSLSDDISAVLDNTNTFTGQTTRTRDKLTELHLTAYSYVATTNTYTAYNAADSGTGTAIKVTFPEPLHSLSITNGSITESGANYAIITANSGCVLTGKRYDKTQSVTVVRNPLVLAGDKENIKELTDYTLVNRKNAEALANKCFAYYSARQQISERIIAGDIHVGDKVTQKYDYMDDISGRIISMKYPVSGTAKVAEVTIT